MTTPLPPATRAGHPTTSLYRPRLTSGRLLAGLLAGMTGGVLLGFPFYAILLSSVEVLTGPLSLGLFWLVHMAISTIVGVAFGILVAPRSYAKSIASAFLVVFLGPYAIGQTLVAMTAGVPFVMDGRAFTVVLAHVVFATILGATYVYYHRLEVSDASRSKRARWREWARREARAR